MWWWNRSKKTEEIEKELPPDLQDFFKSNNPDAKYQSNFELTPEKKQVNKVLSRAKQNYSHDFEMYKKRNTIRNVAAVNCSELQLKVTDCFKTWDLSRLDNCSKEMEKNKACVKIQEDGFRRLSYEDCYSIEHCDKIRFLVDQMFIQNFGQYGEEINDNSIDKFNQNLDKYFYKIWK